MLRPRLHRVRAERLVVRAIFWRRRLPRRIHPV